MKVWIGLSTDGDQRRVPPSVLNAVRTRDQRGEMHRNHRLATVFADYISEPIYGYLRIRIIDERWEQNDKVVTLMRSEIAVIRYIEPEDETRPSTSSTVTEPDATTQSTRASLLEFERSMEKKEVPE